MQSRIGTLCVCTVTLAMTGVWMPVRADDAAIARMRDQLRQTVLQMRQLQDENTELKISLQKAQQQPASQPDPGTPSAAEIEELQLALQAQQQNTAALQAQIEQYRTALAQSQQTLDQTVTAAKACDVEAKKFEVLYRDVDSHVKSCDDNNAKLVEISKQLIDRYKNKGVFAAARDKEPLLGLHRVELERIAQQYHGRIVDATVVPANSSAGSDRQQPEVQTTPR